MDADCTNNKVFVDRRRDVKRKLKTLPLNPKTSA